MNKIEGMSFQEFIPSLEPESIQLCFTSPPYQDMLNYRSNGKVVSGRIVNSDYVQTYWIELFDLLRYAMKEDGIVGIVVNDKRNDGAILLEGAIVTDSCENIVWS